jgi:glycosyltransferase involved in cell wall biosynthesis
MSIRNVLIWSVDPRVRTGYGIQCGLLALELRAAGYHVTIGAIAAAEKNRNRPWKSIPVYYVGGRGTHGADVLAATAERFNADLVLFLFDSFMIDARAIDALPEQMKAACWCPVDAFNVRGGLPVLYRGMLRLAPRAVPLAMSRFGEQLFRDDGFDPLYVPHMIDTSVFRPMDQAELRAEHGVPAGAFVITLCAANSELVRKNFPGQFDAFRRAAQEDWLLLVHSRVDGHRAGGWDLQDLAEYYGIADKVRFADPEKYRKGAYTEADMAEWYNLGDLHTQCTLAEGFGIPLIEAQACGLLVVATDSSAMSELVGEGLAIPAEPFMSPLIRAEWAVPPRESIANAYRLVASIQTHPSLDAMAANARAFALGFSVETVMAEYWKPALEALEER